MVLKLIMNHKIYKEVQKIDIIHERKCKIKVRFIYFNSILMI
jgi:hypothetical protein